MRVYIIVARYEDGSVLPLLGRGENSALIPVDIPDGFFLVDKDEAIDCTRCTNLPPDVVEIELIEFIENRVICKRENKLLKGEQTK